MAKEWHVNELDSGLHEFFDNKPGEEMYKVPSFDTLKNVDLNDEYYVECGFTKDTKFAYWNWNNGDPKWEPMPEHITDIEEAKAYTLFMWRMS